MFWTVGLVLTCQCCHVPSDFLIPRHVVVSSEFWIVLLVTQYVGTEPLTHMNLDSRFSPSSFNSPVFKAVSLALSGFKPGKFVRQEVIHAASRSEIVFFLSSIRF